MHIQVKLEWRGGQKCTHSSKTGFAIKELPNFIDMHSSYPPNPPNMQSNQKIAFKPSPQPFIHLFQSFVS